MSSFDDYEDEMSARETNEEFERFSEGVRAAATRLPTPSPALAHMLTHGVSSPVATKTKRSIFMRVKAYVAGLGVAAKVMLGAGVAVAATGGAAAVVQATHPEEHHEVAIVADTTTTTVHHEQRTHDEPHTTTTVASDDHHEPAVEEPHTTTTVRHEEPHTTTTLRHEEPHTTTTVRHEEPTTTTTTRVEEPTNPESIVLTCSAQREPNRVVCSWTASSNPEHRRYKLLRTNEDFSDGRVMYSTDDHREYVDTTTLRDHTYFYRVVSLREDGSTESHSNGVMIPCC